MSRLSKDDILSRLSKPVETEIKALGGAVLIKKLSAAEAEGYFDSVQVEKDGKAEFVTKDSRAKLIALCVVDETKAPLFTVQEASALDNDVVKELFEACQLHNGMTKEAVENAKKD